MYLTLSAGVIFHLKFSTELLWSAQQLMNLLSMGINPGGDGGDGGDIPPPDFGQGGMANAFIPPWK